MARIAARITFSGLHGKPVHELLKQQERQRGYGPGAISKHAYVSNIDPHVARGGANVEVRLLAPVGAGIDDIQTAYRHAVLVMAEELDDYLKHSFGVQIEVGEL